MAFVFLPSKMVFANTLALIVLQTYGESRNPSITRSRGGGPVSSLRRSKDDLRYTPTDCFETFPFPKDFETHANFRASRARIL